MRAVAPTVPTAGGSPVSPPARTSPWLKMLVGCGVGCGVVVLLAAAGFFAAGWWAVAPGAQVDTGRIAGGESLGVVRSGRLADDPGVRELIENAVVAVQRASNERNREVMPEPLRWMQGLGQARGGSAGLGLWIPREITVTVERGDRPGHPGVVCALNLSAFPRLVRFVIELAKKPGTGGEAPIHYRGRRIDLLNEACVSSAGGTLLFATDLAAMKRALDRLDGRPRARTAGAGGGVCERGALGRVRRLPRRGRRVGLGRRGAARPPPSRGGGGR